MLHSKVGILKLHRCYRHKSLEWKLTLILFDYLCGYSAKLDMQAPVGTRTFVTISPRRGAGYRPTLITCLICTTNEYFSSLHNPYHDLTEKFYVRVVDLGYNI